MRLQVRSMWRSRRAKWRQLTKVAEAVPELGVRLSEFRSALLTDSTFVGCGATWQVTLECRFNAPLGGAHPTPSDAPIMMLNVAHPACSRHDTRNL